MSYASKAKTKLAKIELADKTVMRAELSAIIRSIGELKLGTRFKINLSVSTENAAVARRIIQLIKAIYHKESEAVVKKNRSLKRHLIYEVVTDDTKGMLEQLGILDAEKGLSIVDEIPSFVLQFNEAKRAYLRGLFLTVGSVTDPKTSYHFELALHTKDYANAVLSLFNSFDLNGKMIERKKKFVIYLKDADKIVDALRVIEAYDAVLKLENTRILKSIRNNVNRATNCDTANLKRMMRASTRQMQAIEAIEQSVGLEKLPDQLQEVAELRKTYPEHTLSELGAMLNPPVSKSGINHRMKKIEAIAKPYLEEIYG